MKMLTIDQLRHDIDANGINVADWCRAHGFKAALVYRVLRGESPCRRGETYRIAVALGLKAPSINAYLKKDTNM